MTSTQSSIAPALLAWYDDHGRHDLPWQQERSAYRTWLSEVMLQQTQVATVIPYFERFTTRFFDVVTLANAAPDDVLALWSGLGYYARGRNLHRAAQIIRDEHDGEVPRDFDALLALPGVGRSTAGAILAQTWGDRFPILDGNVKRVLARYHAVDGWPGKNSVATALWQRAEEHTPSSRVADYTQAIMDLGATICSRSKPVCPQCPIAKTCRAKAEERQSEFPGRKPRSVKPKKATYVLLARSTQGEVLLERRPPSGIWGGLWSLPEFTSVADGQQWCRRRFAGETFEPKRLDVINHSFTHYDLTIRPLLLIAVCEPAAAADDDQLRWHTLEDIASLGVPAPIGSLLATLDATQVT